MLYKDIDFRNLKPHVRFAYICSRQGAIRNYPYPLYAYDHRMFYVTQGNITAFLEGKGSYTMQQGSCLIISPNTGYRIDVNTHDGSFAIISFDFDDEFYGKKSRHPDKSEDFCRDEMYSVYTPSAIGDVFVADGCFELSELVADMCRQFSANCGGKYDYSSALMKCIIVKLCTHTFTDFSGKTADSLALKVKSYVDSTFCQSINNESVASHFGYHPYYIGDLFRKAFGTTLHDYIIQMRITKAKGLLVNTHLSVSEIALQCGFSNPCYFSESFRKISGTSPLVYRKTGKTVI